MSVYQLVKDLTTVKQGESTTIQDIESGKCLTEKHENLNRWTGYCSDLYNYDTDTHPTVLDCPQIPDEEHRPTLQEEVEAAVIAVKMGKSSLVDNKYTSRISPSRRRLAMEDNLTSVCNKIWKTGEWPTTWSNH